MPKDIEDDVMLWVKHNIVMLNPKHLYIYINSYHIQGRI